VRRSGLQLGFLISLAFPGAAIADGSFNTSYKIAGRAIPTMVVADRFDPAHVAATQQKIRTRRFVAQATSPKVSSLADPPPTVTLPSSWNCQGRTTDDSVDALSNGPAIKVLYAYTTDRGNRFSEWATTLQRMSASSMNTMLWVSADGSRRSGRTLRYDFGTACNPQELDIQTVALPRAGAEYAYSSGAALYNQLRADTLAVTGSTPSSNQIAMVDGLTSFVGAHGLASNPRDDRPGDVNAAQVGGQVAFLLPDMDGTPTQPFDTYTGTDPGLATAAYVMTHEVLHMLGAVEASAPNSNGSGHTSQIGDIMSASSTVACAEASVETSEVDCGGEDYWNPAPAPGSYLSSHWNLTNSAMLCPANRCTILSHVPFGRINSDIPSAGIGQTVTFDASASSDDDGDQITRYQWDFDGDGLYEAEGETVSTSYPTAGARTIRLRVTDATGEFSLQAKPFTVNGADPTPDPTPTPTPIPNPNLTPNPSSNPNLIPNAYPTPNPTPPWAFNLDRTIAKQKVKAVRSSGAKITVVATAPGKVTVVLSIGPTRVGKASILILKAGTTVMRIKLNAFGRKTLLKRRTTKLRAIAAGASSGYDTATITVVK
jgi:hypothetical protein